MSEDFREGLVVNQNDYSEGKFVDKKNYTFKAVNKVDDEEKEVIYEKYCERQTPQFEVYLDFVNSIMCTLKHYRIVSSATNFTARVKALDSALENDKTKALNDVFGLGINAGTVGESELLYLLLSNGLTSTKNVIHNKENGYAAHHFSGYPKVSNLSEKLKAIFSKKYDGNEMYEQYINSLSDYEKGKYIKNEQDIKDYFIEYYDKLNNYLSKINKIVKGAKLKELEKEIKKIEEKYIAESLEKNPENYQPIIEIQFKTVAVSLEATNGTADHGDYKGIKIEDIQNEYDKNGRLPISRLPLRMYESNIETDEYGTPIPVKRIKDRDEKAAKSYPFLIIKRKEKEQEL